MMIWTFFTWCSLMLFLSSQTESVFGRVNRTAVAETRLRAIFELGENGEPSTLLKVLLRKAKFMVGITTSTTLRTNKLKDAAKFQPFEFVQRFLSAKEFAPATGRVQDIIEVLIELVVKIFAAALTREEVLDIVIGLPLPAICPFKTSINCSEVPNLNEFRTLDGSCNNLNDPILGQAFTPHQRLLPPNYSDRVSEPRANSEGNPLPNAREVSFTIFPELNVTSNRASEYLWIWGAIIDHDFTLTAVSTMVSDDGSPENIACGSDGCDATVDECEPIIITSNDPFFTDPCLMFVRSEGVPAASCEFGPRQQLNQLSHVIDGSVVYGSSQAELDLLRETDGARLLVSQHPFNDSLLPLLPTTSEDVGCVDVDDEVQCFVAGDVRVNEQTLLTVMHVIFVREHNRIVTELEDVNPGMDQEVIFQTTRKIIGAIIQHITYDEFLPLVLGSRSNRADLGVALRRSGFFQDYDDTVDMRTASVFVSAAYRFGHSLLPTIIKRATTTEMTCQSNDDLFLSETFFRPRVIYNISEGGIDAFINGSVAVPVQTIDHFITQEVTQHLFTADPPTGMGLDLPSINVQRARDHGVPGYNDWREFCGLGRLTSFDDLRCNVFNGDVRLTQLFESLYSSVDDIDAFPGFISEPPFERGVVGETLNCIIGLQFRNFRFGDRFWYERPGPEGFTASQLAEIRKVTLSRLFCDNTDTLSRFPLKVMELPRNINPIVDCDTIPGIDFEQFRTDQTEVEVFE